LSKVPLITAVLITIASVALADQYRPTSAWSDIKLIDNAVRQFMRDRGYIPADLDNLAQEGYLDGTATDPWGNRYYFDTNAPYEIDAKLDWYIWSLGSDGMVHGEEVAADIGNWQEHAPIQKKWWQFWRWD
jgi:hypothetical protein